ncbi:MCE family protein [Mycolicibacterium thermoresistibile]
MRTTGAAVKLGIFSMILLLFTALIIVVFGQVRFDRTTRYAAEFSNVSGLRAGQFVRAAGVEVGKVVSVTVRGDDRPVLVDFAVDRSVPLFASTTASIRYQDLIGNRYLELQRGEDNRRLAPGSTIPIERTRPALDLDALIGGFRPLLRALDPDKVNSIAESIVTALQGQGDTVGQIIDHTAQLTSRLADRDETIGALIADLNVVLDTTVRYQDDFDDTLANFETLVTALRNRADPLADAVAHISDAAGTVGDLLADERPVLKDTIVHLQEVAQPLIDDVDNLDDLLTRWPEAFKTIGRAGGIYGDFFNFYLCDLNLKLNGLQPGGPVRTVRITHQPSGRCTPQ